MSTLLEAIQHARSGGTAYRGAKQIRFLTFAEAESIILNQSPSRRVVRDEKGVVEKDGKIVVETFANPRFKLARLGLYDVSQNPPVPFQPTDEDIAGDWSMELPAPEVVAPEVVDMALHETVPPETEDNTGPPPRDDIHD